MPGDIRSTQYVNFFEDDLYCYLVLQTYCFCNNNNVFYPYFKIIGVVHSQLIETMIIYVTFDKKKIKQKCTS